MCTHKAQKCDFCTHQAHFSLIAAFSSFPRKYGRKNDQNFTNFFFQKIDIKKRSETQFHQNPPKIRDFRLKLARHENFTSSENGGNSNPTTSVKQN